jgi:hypothetical protein
MVLFLSAATHWRGSLGAVQSGCSREMQVNVRLRDRSVCCVDVEAHVEASPAMLFDILADPNNHPGVFDSIKVGCP